MPHHMSFAASTLYQSIPWSMETTKVILVGKPPSLKIMLWSLLPCCSLYITIKAFHDCGWSSVTIGATSYFSAWFNMDESLYSQAFLGLSQWQLGIGPTLCNALPKNIQLCATLAAFKTNLKTYLFKKAYRVWLCTLLIYFTSDLFLLYTLIFYLYHFIVSAVSVTSHNWMLHFNAISQLYNSYILYCLVCMFYLYFMYSAGEHCGSVLYKSINY